MTLTHQTCGLRSHHYGRGHHLIQLILSAMHIGFAEIAETVAPFNGLNQVAAALSRIESERLVTWHHLCMVCI